MARVFGGKCPHEKVQFCPLYVGMHIVGSPNCWHRDLNVGCSVDHGASYEDLIAQFFRADPQMFAEITMAERADEGHDQRDRNLRALNMQ